MPIPVPYLAPVRTAIDEWHAGGRPLGRFPEQIGATVYYEPGGGRVLGMAHRGNIVINEDICGTNLHAPVLAHECAHVLLHHKRVHPCLRCPEQSRGERRAWKIAALLCIPQTVIELFIAGALHARDVATICDVPAPLVALRYAMESTGSFMLDTAQRHAQTMCWLEWLSHRVDASSAASPAPSYGIVDPAVGWRSSAVRTGTA